MRDNIKIGVIGLGYVGLPVALAFAKEFPGTIGYDKNEDKILSLKAGLDRTNEIPKEILTKTSLRISSDYLDLKGCNFIVICVPTPVDIDRRPDLSPLISASELVAKIISKGSTIVYESTVYPGVTEEICGPTIERISGLNSGTDFKLGYSPERINPGDKEHAIDKIVKVVSGQDLETLELVSEVYSKITNAGVFKASSIKVAEAAKVIENTQRDLNIALMNELSIIFEKMNISTMDVLAAASTKWNFLKFTPGLVGGHCIGVDPYYLTTKAEQLGYSPQVILAGRKINDGMGKFIARKAIKMRVNSGYVGQGMKAGILGLTFKENVSDVRNSRVPDIIRELAEFGVKTFVHDPLAIEDEAVEEYGMHISDISDFEDLDILILAVSHDYYKEWSLEKITGMLKTQGVLIDVKSALDPQSIPKNLNYWSL
ncbi:MAG: nucleotide sugar dehydrogenase [bacterium]|nr:nucleotide sugar dehydrogenase [bacterium]